MKYELKIRDILANKGLLPNDLKGNDVGFTHNGKEYYVEVKNADAPDFGQKRIRWSQDKGWYWAIEDEVTALYDKYNILDEINPKYIPRRHSKENHNITLEDKIYNQRHFEKSGIVFEDPSIIYEYYARKECHYIQIENMGFYYFSKDLAKLGVPQIKPIVTVRLRAKTHHSTPVYAYSFFAVIQIKRNIEKSPYDLEEKAGVFPDIRP